MIAPRRSLLVLILIALVWPVSAPAQVGEVFTAPVTRVADGDTITVTRAGDAIRIRLDGIDTPATNHPFGRAAAAFLSARVLHQHVTVTVKDVDRYGRFVSRVSVGGEDLSLTLVAAGLAWHYVRYSDDAALARAEADARTKKIGLWTQSAPVAPWEFRRQSRRR